MRTRAMDGFAGSGLPHGPGGRIKKHFNLSVPDRPGTASLRGRRQRAVQEIALLL